MIERRTRSPCLKAFARLHVAFACATLPCTAFAQSDPMQLARLVDANQTGVMEYCQGQGWADQTAVDAQKANASSLPPATDTTEILAAEATGKTGSLLDNGTAMPLSSMAAQTHTTVQALCGRLLDSAKMAVAQRSSMPGIPGMPSGMPALPTMPATPGMPKTQ